MIKKLFAIFLLVLICFSIFGFARYVAPYDEDYNNERYVVGEPTGKSPTAYDNVPVSLDYLNWVLPTLRNINILGGTNITVLPDALNSTLTISADINASDVNGLSEADANKIYVPYIGATQGVNLGAYGITATTFADGTATLNSGNLWGVRIQDDSENPAINPDFRILLDSSNIDSVDWASRYLVNSSLETVFDWENQRFEKDINGINIGISGSYFGDGSRLTGISAGVDTNVFTADLMDSDNNNVLIDVNISKINPIHTLSDINSYETSLEKDSTGATRYDTVAVPAFSIAGADETYTSGGFTYEVFKSSGNAVVSGSGNVEALIIAGGGGGGRNNNPTGTYCGGAGAGGLKYVPVVAVSGTMAVTVGAGGTVPAGEGVQGGNGGNSSFGGSTATGGGGGSTRFNTGKNGGSGGGETYNSGHGTGVAGQGYDGGQGSTTGSFGGGGGGGCGQIGQDAVAGTAGDGGDGNNDFSTWATATSTGESGYYCGGGAGGQSAGNGWGAGGAGGGADGTGGVVQNTGSGGRACRTNGSGGSAGAKGIVILRYPSGSGTPTKVQVWDSGDGVEAGEQGTIAWGNDNSGTEIRGQTIDFLTDGSNTATILLDGDWNFLNNLRVLDNKKRFYGTADDYSEYFDGTNMFGVMELGNGEFRQQSDFNVDEDYNFFGNQIYGELNAYDSNLTIPSSGTYYPYPDSNAGLNNGFAVTDGNLIAEVGGVYSFVSQWSFSGLANNEYHLSLFKNHVQQDKCHSERKMGTGGDVGSASFVCLLRLEVGDIIAPTMENDTAGNDATIHDFQLIATRVGH